MNVLRFFDILCWICIGVLFYFFPVVMGVFCGVTLLMVIGSLIILKYKFGVKPWKLIKASYKNFWTSSSIEVYKERMTLEGLNM